ncbi:hypothetical protein AAKU55_001808 [Oxalobacteraceae bacterium GrIS 1.11]
MNAIAIELALAGMVLADDLKDAGGAVLLPAGATLTDGNLRSLRRRGIQACPIAQPSEPEDEVAKALRLERSQQRLRRLFRSYAESTPLLRLLISYRSKG